MKWVKGLPPIHKVEVLYLFKYRTYYTFEFNNEQGWHDEYFLASPIDPKLEGCNANNIWHFDFLENLKE